MKSSFADWSIGWRFMKSKKNWKELEGKEMMLRKNMFYNEKTAHTAANRFQICLLQICWLTFIESELYWEEKNIKRTEIKTKGMQEKNKARVGEFTCQETNRKHI